MARARDAPVTITVLLRLAVVVGASLLIVGGLVLGYIAVIALRRNEGVFLPAGYVAVLCLVAGWALAWYALRH